MGTKTTVDQTRVIDVAAALADEHGYDAVTLAMVAGELGLRSQSLYAHVDGIQGLRDGLALRGHALLADRLGDAAMARAGSDALRSVVGALAGFARQHPGLYQASLRSPGESRAIAAASDRTVTPLMAVLRSFGLKGDELVHHYRVIWSSVHGFVTLRHAGLLSWPADPDLSFDLMVTMFVHELEQR